MSKHKINWLNKPGYIGRTWNPIIGCSHISEGCQNCYAEKMAFRLANIKATEYYKNVLIEDWYEDNGVEKCHTIAKWSGKTHFVESAITKPLHWKKPSMIFVCSMGDLFHDSIRTEWIMRIWNIMRNCPQHIFVILTKRPENALTQFKLASIQKQITAGQFFPWIKELPNVWFGVTAENQKRADERIPVLLQIPAPVRFVSCEPMLGEINLTKTHELQQSECCRLFCPRFYNYLSYLDWVIVGGESGNYARQMPLTWAKSIQLQCEHANVPFFFKQRSDSDRNQVRKSKFTKDIKSKYFKEFKDNKHLLFNDEYINWPEV